jgi:hypothetical protein
MLGRSVGEGGRGFGVDREEQASETEEEALKNIYIRKSLRWKSQR